MQQLEIGFRMDVTHAKARVLDLSVVEFHAIVDELCGVGDEVELTFEHLDAVDARLDELAVKAGLTDGE